MIDRATALMWWRHLDSVAHKLVADNAHRDLGERRTPTNPRHTADFLVAEAMLCAADADERCRSFAITRSWPNDLSGDEFSNIQHRLCCAKGTLEYMFVHPDDEKAIALQTNIPDPLKDTARFIEFLLIPVWRLIGDIFLEDQANQLQRLLPPGELERLWATNPALHG